MKKRLSFVLAVLVVLAAGCSKIAPENSENILDAMPQSVKAYSIEEYTNMLSKDEYMSLALSAAQLQGIYMDGRKITPDENSIAEGDNLGLLVSSTKVQYTTKGPSGEEINVSGRITFPFFPSMARNIILCPMMTTIGNDLAPSVMDYAVPADLLALLGYVVVSPDYIGYGDSKDVRHPYVHNALTAQTCVDMLDRVKDELGWYWKFLKKGMPTEIYIMGYSQGGGAALSCARYIEEKRSKQYSILRTYAGSGPYSLSATMDYYISTNHTVMASVLPYVVLGLQYGDNLNIDLSKLFKTELYENYKEWYFTKKYSSTEIDNFISHNGSLTKVTDFINDDFIKDNFGGNTDMQAFYQSCKANDNIDWTPKSPLILFHSTDDDVVPFVNAQKAYDSFIGRGADPNNVRLMTVKGSTHIFSAFPFYLKVAADLN